jgi:HSP20 family protein
MAMVRWDPFNEMMTMQRDMNRLFSSLGMPLYASKGDGERVSWMPALDVVKQGDDLLIRAELPGVKPEDVDVSVTDDVLTIKGSRKEERRYEEGEYVRRESSYGGFERQVMLPQGTKAEDIRGEYRDGILEITVPGVARQLSPQTQHIPISGSTEGGGGRAEPGQPTGGVQEHLGTAGTQTQTQGRQVRVTEESGE